MRVELSAASRCEHLVLYDRAAIPPDTPVDSELEAQEPALPPKNAIRKLATDGHAPSWGVDQTNRVVYIARV